MSRIIRISDIYRRIFSSTFFLLWKTVNFDLHHLMRSSYRCAVECKSAQSKNVRSFISRKSGKKAQFCTYKLHIISSNLNETIQWPNLLTVLVLRNRFCLQANKLAQPIIVMTPKILESHFLHILRINLNFGATFPLSFAVSFLWKIQLIWRESHTQKSTNFWKKNG